MARLIKHTKYRKYQIATAILLMVVVGIAAFPSQSSGPTLTLHTDGSYQIPGQIIQVTGTNFEPNAVINSPGDGSIISYAGSTTGLKSYNMEWANSISRFPNMGLSMECPSYGQSYDYMGSCAESKKI